MSDENINERLEENIAAQNTEENAEKATNPWLAIWIRPRVTIRWILNNKKSNIIILLAALGGSAYYLDQSASENYGDKMPYLVTIGLALLVGAIIGIVFLYIMGALIKWVGGWNGGKGSYSDIRTAYAWSFVPSIWALILWIPKLTLFGQELFISNTPRINSSPTLMALNGFFGFLDFAILIWSVIIFLVCIAEAHQFSIWNAIETSFLIGIIFIIPCIFLAGLIMPGLY